jgi:HSP20 family protein
LPSVDIYENDDEILLHADMPGVKKDDVSVNIDNGTLSLSGVRDGLTKKGLQHGKNFLMLNMSGVFPYPRVLMSSGWKRNSKMAYSNCICPNLKQPNPR